MQTRVVYLGEEQVLQLCRLCVVYHVSSICRLSRRGAGAAAIAADIFVHIPVCMHVCERALDVYVHIYLDRSIYRTAGAAAIAAGGAGLGLS